ncbi:MAG: hypothetical protein F4107_09100 [Gemmatimonadetes bacterium]|nr:hypothetical protein [Gemmatimonadota bacterium]MYI66072.1 hypothetical protein [Gemmatimonadota bacterium]
MTEKASPATEQLPPAESEDLTLTTRDDLSGPALVDEAWISHDLMGMVVVHFFHDYLALPDETTVRSGGRPRGTLVPRRHVRASLVMAPTIARVIGKELASYAEAMLGEEEEE